MIFFSETAEKKDFLKICDVHFYCFSPHFLMFPQTIAEKKNSKKRSTFFLLLKRTIVFLSCFWGVRLKLFQQPT
jgi:hypothetical protein